eukprot:5934306-Alexandrium_andersonii.AAC.1
MPPTQTSSSAVRTSRRVGAVEPRSCTALSMESFCPGSRCAGRSGAAGCPVRLGSSLRPRAMMECANALRRWR